MYGGSDAGREGERGCCTWSRSWRRASLRKIMIQYGIIADPMARMSVAKRTGDDRGWTVYSIVMKHIKTLLNNDR